MGIKSILDYIRLHGFGVTLKAVSSPKKAISKVYNLTQCGLDAGSITYSERFLEYFYAASMIKTVREDSRILDVGCGGSIFTFILAGFFPNLVGIDTRDLSNDHLPYNFKVEDVTKLSFVNEYFNVITCISTLEHIGLEGRYGSREDLQGDQKAMNEMYRVLKPKGKLILTVPYGKNFKVVRPLHRIYDDKKINSLIVRLFRVIDKKYGICEKEQKYRIVCRKEALNCSIGGYSKNKYRLLLLTLEKS